VFFDWDKATLTDRARQIIAEAAGGDHRPLRPLLDKAADPSRLRA
jgi:hypothetical protein